MVGRVGEKAWEAAWGTARNSERIYNGFGKEAFRSAAYRIPDYLRHDLRLVGDVKNTAYLPYTDQLKDVYAWSVARGYVFVIWTNGKLAPELRVLRDAGEIVVLPISK